MKIYATDFINYNGWERQIGRTFNLYLNYQFLSLKNRIKYQSTLYVCVDYFEIEINEVDRTILSVKKIDKEVIKKLTMLL